MLLYQTNISILSTILLMLILLVFLGCNGEKPSEQATSVKSEAQKAPGQPPPAKHETAAQAKQEATAQAKQEVTKPAQKEIPQTVNPRVLLQTSLGDIFMELNPQAAPVTVENFQRYVSEGFFDGVIFHRVIAGFMIQGGGLTPDMQEKRTNPPIINEASNGLKNDRGTVSMARTSDPNSASSQFFINVVDNVALDYTGPAKPGYAVFGKVVEGMEVVDKIAAVRTTSVGPFRDVPVEPVAILKATLIKK